MKLAAVPLVAQTVPIAGLLFANTSTRPSDFLVIGYLASVGLLLSATILLGQPDMASAFCELFLML